MGKIDRNFLYHLHGILSFFGSLIFVSLSIKKATQSAIVLQILLFITALLFFPSFSQAAPVSEETPASFSRIVKGSNYRIGLKSDGTVWGCGSNDHGQLGVEKSVTSVPEDSPVEMQTSSGPLDQITDIISYHDISYALRLDGRVWSAGDATNKSDLAKEIPGIGNIISFSIQQGELLFQTRDGGFYKSDGTFYQPGTNIPFYQASATALLSVSSLAAGSELPDSWQLEYFGYTGVDPSALAPSGNGKTILECYLEGIDPTEALPEEPFALSLSAEGPYRARANVTLVASVTHPEGRDISKIEFYCQGQCLATNTERPYEFTTNYSQGQFLIEAIAYDSSGRAATGSKLITIEPSNWYSRGLGTDPKYKSSLIAIDEGKGVFLDKIDDFNGIYGIFPWFLRTDSEEKDPCRHVMVDPANPTYVGREAVNTIPQTNGISVGGAPAMVAFGSEGRGDSLYVNQDYHFGILCGIPKVENGLKIEVYDKDDFSSGKTNVKPAVVRSYNLPNPKNRDEWDDFYQKGHLKEIHLQENIHGKMADFETQVQYSSGGPSDTLAMALPYYPLLITHRAANNNFYYKVSFQGEAVDPKNPSQRIAMSLPSSNISYTLDFENVPAWSAAILSDPHFQRSLLPSQYQGKSIDELIHQTPEVKDTLSTLESSGFTQEQLTKVDNSPELKSHHELDKLSDMLGNNPMVIANYVQNEIEITDAIGYNTTGNSNDYSLNSQGVMRDALGTYLEGQGSPIEQCELLVYLLRKAGYPAAYVFPEHNSSLMFDEQLSKVMHMQMRGTLAYDGQSYIPELIAVNYPWVATYIDGKWIHLFPWIKDTEVKEGKDIWNYFPEGYNKTEEWLYHYILNDPQIRGLSDHGKEDNAGTLFKMYAEEVLKKENLTLDDVGIRFKNRPHYYRNWSDFPKPWKTPIIKKENIAQNLDLAQNLGLADQCKHQLKNIFNTISIEVISDRNRNAVADPGEPVLKTGDMRFVDLHNRRLLLYHQLIPGSKPAKYRMILSLEPYDTKDSNTTAYSFYQGEKPDPGDLRNPQKISTILQTTENPKDIQNDDQLLYKITTKTQQKIEDINATDGSGQFPNTIARVGTSELIRPLRKGDMAALSINYGKVSSRMLDFEVEKYKEYKKKCDLDPDALRDPEQLTGQMLQCMGESYYFKVSSMAEELEQLFKVHTVSWRACGLSKLSPERDSNGSPVITADGNDFNLIYPRVDMYSTREAVIGNETSHLESGDLSKSSKDFLKFTQVDGSAQEHRVINECFNQDGAISTIKLLDIAQGWTPETGVASSPGKGVVIMDHSNYQRVKTDHPKTGNPKIDSKSIEEWAKYGGIWSSIENALSKDEDWLNVVFLNDSPQVAPGEKGKGYIGMGAFILCPNQATAAITDSLSIDNGGYGTPTKEISSYDPETSSDFNYWVQAPPIIITRTVIYDNTDLSTLTPSYNPSDTKNIIDNTQPVQQQGVDGQDQLNKWMQQVSEERMWQQINKELHSSPGSSASNAPSNNNSSAGVKPTPTPPPTPPTTPPAGTEPIAQPTPVPAAAAPELTPLSSLEIETLKKEMSNNGFIGAPSYYGKLLNAVMDPVSVVTGEFYSNDLDLKLSGPMPLEIRRTYGSQNLANNNFGYGWKLGYFPYLMLSADSTTTPSLIYAAESDGSVIAYRYQENQKNWVPKASDNPDLINSNDGKNLTSRNLFNSCITQTTSEECVSYTLRNEQGEVRVFKTRSFPIIGSPEITRTRPYLDRWSDSNGNFYSFHYGSNNIASDWGELISIESNNGEKLSFSYDPYGHISQIFSNDGRRVSYNYDGENNLIKVIRPDNSSISYSYEKETHLLTQEINPERGILVNQYDGERRVTTQSSTVGSSPIPKQSAKFNYAVTTSSDNTISGTTTVTDGSGNSTTYTLNSSQIAGIKYPNNNSISQTWDPSSHNLTSRTDERGLTTSFTYDGQGNLLSRTLTGNITGTGNSDNATTSMTYNGNNTLESITDPVGNKTSYRYEDQAHPHKPTSIIQTANNCITKLTYGDYGLPTSEVISANNTTTSEKEYTYDPQGYLTSATQKTGTSDPSITTIFTSNNRGEIIAVTDPSGAKKTYDYDGMGRCTSEEVYDRTGALIDWHFWYYNGNGELQWEQGARFNPVDYTYYDYDYAGHLRHKMTWLSAALGNMGVISSTQATTSYEYENGGNLTKITDANGHVTTMTYDAANNMNSRISGDGLASESFTYEPGGKVATHTTALGGTENYTYTATGLLTSVTYADGTTSAYEYDLIGRKVKETFPSGLICTISYSNESGTITRSYSDGTTETETLDAGGKTIASTDRAGNKFTKSFDGLGRLKNVTGPNGTQSELHTYNPKKQCESIINALHETTNIFKDPLGRSTLMTVFNSDGSVAKNRTYLYSPDHQSVTVCDGTGNDAITTTFFTDLQNRPLIAHHSDGGSEVTAYDAEGNKISFSDETGLTTTWTYDALNRKSSEVRPRGATINFTYNPAGEILSRSMPAGLTEKNSYNAAGQKTSNELVGSDGSSTRNHSYAYGKNGLVSSITDPRGFTTSIEYDLWNHPTSISSSGATTPEQNQKTTYTYDPRGLLTSVAQNYADALTGPGTLVTRDYDGYGQIISETTSVNGTNVSSWTEAWNSAGRRTGLQWTLDSQGPSYGFAYNAMGLMTSASNSSGACNYIYADNGLLKTRVTPESTINIERDNVGRIMGNQIKDNAGSLLFNEGLSYQANGKISTYSVLPSGLGVPEETRSYTYDGRGRIIREPYLLNGQQTAQYLFDEKLSNRSSGQYISLNDGLAVRTLQFINWSMYNGVMAQNNFAQVTSDNIYMPEYNGTFPWASCYDALGEVISRSPGIFTQNLTWDSFGHLAKVAVIGTLSDYTCSTLYDGLGRRIQTKMEEMSSGPLTISYYNDPEVEFLELGHDNNGRTWNLYGPDRSGTYGGAQGIGGLEATWQLSGNVTSWSINNAFGDSIGVIDSHGHASSYNSVLGGYGPMPGYAFPAYQDKFTPQWRGHYLDWSGFYYMGARYYEPSSGRFLSADPLGHDTSLSLYDYCNGDPVNGLDADGRDAMSLGDGSGNYYYITRKDFNASNVIGSVITHPNPNCSGQCMTGAQFLTGTVVKGAIYDAPRSATFTQGDTVNRNTPMNSMVATGWINGKYPSAPISAYQPGGRLDGQDINHVGIFMGMNPGGKSFKLLNQWTGQPMHVDPEDSDKYSLVLGTEQYDDRAPSVAIPVKATGGCGR